VRTGARDDQILVAYYVVADRRALADPAGVLRAHIRRTLPEFMVPNAFVEIPAVPRSPSGKVERRALPTPVGQDDADVRTSVAPRTTLEHELVHIWKALLRKESIGIRDDFFELGGHSLLAAQMLFEIELARGQRLPLAALFDGATIEQLAARLEAAIEDEREPDVVVLQGEGTSTPFAFVHGDVRGGGWYCRRMAALLGSDVPVIVLPTLRPHRAADLRTIEEMAALHVATLRRVQPHGPYRLGGFCVGGLIAYEMARQLTASGERVERVVVIDSNGSNSRFRWLAPALRAAFRSASDEDVARRAELLRGLRYYTGRIQRVRRMKRADQWRWLRTNVARRLPRAPVLEQRVVEVLTFSGERNERSAEFEARPATQLLRFQERAALAYIPGPYSGALDVIWAADQFPPRSVDQTRGWARVASDVRVHTVSSAHVGLITYNLPTLAGTLRTILRSEESAFDS
jgi:thioesterase domain-containing protein